ncbi:polyprenyl synthetase family protein [bacterium]|nr:polyprenyl synthetase family protein [bacterium]
MAGFQQQLQRDAAACDAALKQLIVETKGSANRLLEAMQYAVFNGGKRMRAALVLGASRMALGAADAATKGTLRTAAAIECLHAYSLVHDDLPAMDDADMRRGKPSLHKVFGDATAILAGDALQTMAFEILAGEATHDDAAIRLRLVAQLADASGLAGMAGGQMLDLEAETRPFNLAEASEMQMMKTGALISCAVISGGIVGGADDQLLAAQVAYAKHLGLAFQIADDLLDYEGDSTVLGKPAGQDAARGKASFVALMGGDAAAAEAKRLIDEANNALAPWQGAGKYMQDLAVFAITRKT